MQENKDYLIKLVNEFVSKTSERIREKCLTVKGCSLTDNEKLKILLDCKDLPPLKSVSLAVAAFDFSEWDIPDEYDALKMNIALETLQNEATNVIIAGCVREDLEDALAKFREIRRKYAIEWVEDLEKKYKR